MPVVPMNPRPQPQMQKPDQTFIDMAAAMMMQERQNQLGETKEKPDGKAKRR